MLLASSVLAGSKKASSSKPKRGLIDIGDFGGHGGGFSSGGGKSNRCYSEDLWRFSKVFFVCVPKSLVAKLEL